MQLARRGPWVSGELASSLLGAGFATFQPVIKQQCFILHFNGNHQADPCVSWCDLWLQFCSPGWRPTSDSAASKGGGRLLPLACHSSCPLATAAASLAAGPSLVPPRRGPVPQPQPEQLHASWVMQKP